MMIGLLSAGAAGAAGLCAAEVLDLGKFVAVVIDDFVLGQSGGPEGLQKGELSRQDDD